MPKGEEVRWYALFSATDKVASRYVVQADWRTDLFLLQSSSFLGPLFVGLISDATGNIQYACFFFVFMVWLAAPILLSVNVEQGRTDARNYHTEGLVDENEL